MNIKRIHILLGFGTDKVFLFTDLPEASYPYNGNLCLEFNCVQDCAQTFIAEHFPNIPVEITNRIKY